eukprot:gene10160-8819_t
MAAEITSDHACPLVDDLIRHMLERVPAQRATIPEIKEHPLFSTIRIVKGQPVENYELSLFWDKGTSVLKAAAADGRPDSAGAVGGSGGA